MFDTLVHFFLSISYGFIGYSSCHQIPERTISFDGKLLFVCCRCSGIYIGYFISYLFIYLIGRQKFCRFPPGKVIVFGVIISSLMLFDVLSVLFHLRYGSNDIRIITGLLVGSFLPFIVFPIINRLLNYECNNEERIITTIWPYLLVIIPDGIAFFIVKSGIPVFFWIYFFIIFLGLLFIYINLNSILFLLFFKLIYVNNIKFFFLIIGATILSFIEMLGMYLFFKFLGVK